MGSNICGCNNNQNDGNETNVFSPNQPINNIKSRNIKNKDDLSTNNCSTLSNIQKITLKNQTNKIINAYKKYKLRTNLTSSQYTNDIMTDISPSSPHNKNDYIGMRDSRGNKSGFGIQKIPDGSKFRGIFSNDKANGWGIYEHKDGDSYRGQYENDRISGYGEYTHTNGAVYYGYWIDFQQFGIGYEIWNDSSKYSGEYNNGKKDGIGTYIWSDQTMYSGEWKNNNIQGYGIYNYADGRQYSGEWKNNLMHGYGEIVYPEGKKYAGFFKNDKKDGFGIYFWPNNKFFVGFWRDGKQNGVGKYIKGEVIKYGLWEEGKRENWFVNEDEFANCLDPRDERYASIFQWGRSQLKKFLEVSSYNDDNECDNINDLNKSIRSYRSTKSIRSRQTIRDDDKDEENY